MSLIREPKLPKLEQIINKEKKEQEQEPELPIKPARCENCGKIYYERKGQATQAYKKGKPLGFCSGECREMFRLYPLNSFAFQRTNNDDSSDDEMDQTNMDEFNVPMSGGIRGEVTEITDNTLEKKLIDATAPYNEKAAKNAKNFAKASIEVGKAILDQLNLNPLAFIEKTKELGVKIYKITQEGIYLLFPGDANIGQSVNKLIKSGTKLYFIPVRILGTIAITIFLSMFGVSIDLKFLEKIPGLKPFIDLIIKYTSIITKILKNFNIPGLSIPTLGLKKLLFPNVIDAAYRKGDYEGGSKKKKKKTRRKKRRKN